MLELGTQIKGDSSISGTEFIHLLPLVILLVFLYVVIVYSQRTPLSYSRSSLGQLVEALAVGTPWNRFFQSSDLGIVHEVEHFLFRFFWKPTLVNGKSQKQCNVMGGPEGLFSKYITLKFFGSKLSRSSMLLICLSLDVL